MNWTEILSAAGIPEPPGREEAIAVSLAWQKEKKARQAAADAAKAQKKPPRRHR